MNFETLLVERRDALCIVTLNRPDKLNALSQAVFSDLDALCAEVERDDTIRGVVITGAGEKSFCAGADVTRFHEMDSAAGHAFSEAGQRVFDRLERLPVPVVAAINGFALGGGLELALACHMRVAAENAQLGFPEVSLGLIPGYGGTQRLPRLVGRGIAAEMILTGDRISAERAYQVGLVNRVTPPGGALEGAMELLAKILSRAPLACGMALRAIAASDGPLEQGLTTEAAFFGVACGTQDFREGIAAHSERRPPDFKGK